MFDLGAQRLHLLPPIVLEKMPPRCPLSTSWPLQRLGSPQRTLPLQLPLNWFSHTPRLSRRGGGTGLLISPKWSYQALPLEHLTRSAFELHAVALSLPIKLYIAVIYRPPGPLHDFFDEMDALLSCFPDDGTPFWVMSKSRGPGTNLTWSCGTPALLPRFLCLTITLLLSFSLLSPHCHHPL